MEQDALLRVVGRLISHSMRLAEPTIATASSLPTISRADAVAVAGSPLSSAVLYSIIRPSSPPSALNASNTAAAASDASGKAAGPLFVLIEPTTIGDRVAPAASAVAPRIRWAEARSPP